MLYCIVLYCIVLYCIVLYCIVLYCTIVLCIMFCLFSLRTVYTTLLSTSILYYTVTDFLFSIIFLHIYDLNYTFIENDDVVTRIFYVSILLAVRKKES